MAPLNQLPIESSVFIAKHPFRSEAELIDFFTQAEYHVRAIKRAGNLWAIVMLDSQEERDRAISELNQMRVEGRNLYVNQVYPSSKIKETRKIKTMQTAVKFTNLSDNITEEDISDMLSEYSVSKISISPSSIAPGRGHAIIDFRNPHDPAKVVQWLNLSVIANLVINVEICTDSHDLPPQQRYTFNNKKGRSRNRFIRNHRGPALNGTRPPMFFQHFINPLRSYSYNDFSIENQLAAIIREKLGANKSVALRPASIELYKKIFSSLLYADEIRMMIDIRQYDLENQKIYRDTGKLHIIKVPRLAEKRPSILRGDTVKVQSTYSNQNYNGYVHHVNLEDIRVSLHYKFNSSELYNIQFTFTRTPLKIQHRAIEQMNNDVWNKLNGVGSMIALPSVIRSLSIIGRVSLNQEQRRAVYIGTQSPSCPLLIHGPPGTGKTATVVEMILQLAKKGKSKILVCTPSNSAADLIASLLSSRLSSKELLRLNALQRSPRSLDPPSLLDFCWGGTGTTSFTLPPMESLKEYNVVVCTCIAAGYLVSMGIETGFFSHIIVDEAGEALETETLVPLQMASKETVIVLAGDHKQLGPIVRSPTALEWRFDRSMMERLIENKSVNLEVTKLVRSYRAHPKILHLYSSLFYNNELIPCADSKFVNSLCNWKKLPNPEVPMMFVHTNGVEDREPDSPSWFNTKEIDQVAFFIKSLTTELYVKTSEIGIITPYRKQADKLQKIYRQTCKDIKIGTVENFQGMERKVIIVSLVRSREQHLKDDKKFKLGFCSNPKRLNVAVSRAQALLIVIGNECTYCREYNLFYGPPPTWTLCAGSENNDNANNNSITSNTNSTETEQEVLNVDQAWRDDY